MKIKRIIVTLLFIPINMLFSMYAFTPIIFMRQEAINNKVNASEVLNMYKNPAISFRLLHENKVLIKEIIVISFICLGVFFIIFYIIKNSEEATKQKGINYLEDNGTDGTANWMNIKEAKMVLGIGKEEGLVFGEIKQGTGLKMVTLPEGTLLNKNVAVFGASGSMKSRSFVRPNIMQICSMGESMIITDPKGEIFESMSKLLKERGYTVKVLNLVSMTNSDRWNPLDEITDDISAQSFIEVIMANTGKIGEKKDEFWENAEKNLLKALVLYVVNENPKDKRNMAEVYKMLASNDAATLDEIFRSLSKEHPAKLSYNIYSKSGENVRAGVIIGLGSRLQVFQNKLLQGLTAFSDIELAMPKRKKCAYFCITSDMESTFDFIAGIFFSFLFIKLTKYADYEKKIAQKHVYFLLDEFPNIGSIPDFTKKISTMRSRGISTCIIFQNISQLENRYPSNGWSEIIGNCDSKLFLGATDYETAQFVSRILGTSTVEKLSVRKKSGIEAMFDYGDISKSTEKRYLMNPDEILRLENNKEILMLRGEKPIILQKMDYTKHRLYSSIKEIEISDYKPLWVEAYLKEMNNKNEENKKVMPKVKKDDFW